MRPFHSAIALLLSSAFASGCGNVCPETCAISATMALKVIDETTMQPIRNPTFTPEPGISMPVCAMESESSCPEWKTDLSGEWSRIEPHRIRVDAIGYSSVYVILRVRDDDCSCGVVAPHGVLSVPLKRKTVVP